MPKKITKRAVAAAFHTSLPIIVTFLVLGTGYGILMQKHGFGPAWSLLAFDSTGIDFAMTALFITVFIQQWIDSKCHIPAILGVTATLLCRLVFGEEYFLIPAMIIILITLTVMRSKIDAAWGEEKDD